MTRHTPPEKDELFKETVGPNTEPTKVDNVNPKHYTSMAISPIEYIKANEIPWNEANAIKYISRHSMKNGIEDLEKAIWYIKDLIATLKENGEKNAN